MFLVGILEDPKEILCEAKDYPPKGTFIYEITSYEHLVGGPTALFVSGGNNIF